MKNILSTITVITSLGTVAQAATLQSISATGNPSADGWSVSLDSGDGTKNGEFNGDSATNGGGSAAGAGSAAWALYANDGNNASATFTLAGGALSVGQIASLDFDNGWIDTPSVVGVRFLNSGVEVLGFTFTGGQANYNLSDGTTTDTGIGFTADGLNLALTLTSLGNYSLNVSGNVFTGTLNNGQTSFDQVRVVNESAGGGVERNVFFNNLSVTQVPEPSSSALLALGGLALVIRRRRG